MQSKIFEPWERESCIMGSIIICPFTKFYQGDQTNDDGRTCSIHAQRLKGRNQLGGLGIGGSMVLKWILKD
jgi:hypothetical protein